MNQGTVLWRRLDQPGHEFARLWGVDSNWHLSGTAIFAYDRGPCQLNYHLICDANWHTRSGTVTGWVGDRAVEIELSVDATQVWWLNGSEVPAVAGCFDLDLNFSPSTNLLPIRRLGLEVGQSTDVKAAWLRFPSFTLEPLEQVYRHIAAKTYRYESAGGKFVRDLDVNAAGFVTDYPGFWAQEA